MKKEIVVFAVSAVAFLALGCGSGEKTKKQESEPVKEQAAEQPAGNTSGKADVITVQHVLIGFQGSVPGKPITRTREEAKALADELFQKAKAGADFDAMVKQYT